MTKDDIIALPHKSLRRPSQNIDQLNRPVKQLIKAMQTATLDWEASREHEVGVALAAVQVDQLVRLIVVREKFDDKTDRNFKVYINPVITKYEGKLVEDYEGCLSVQDIYGLVPRYEKVRLKALNELGKPIRLAAEGFLARVFQHEIDHTEGIMFIDHIKNQPGAFFRLDKEGHLSEVDYKKDVQHNKRLWQK